MIFSTPERLESITSLVEQNRHISIGDVCQQFSVSVATARRDLQALADQGKIQRVRGGAIALRHAPPEPPANRRRDLQVEEKRRIGRAAADLVADGDTVLLGSSTTVLHVAQHLRTRRNLTVITNSIPVINVFADVPEITVIVLGGVLRRSEMSLIGHLTEQSLRELRADKVIFGVRAVDPEQGFMNDYLPETMTDREILSIGREVIIVADHTKCNRIAPVLVAPLNAAQVLVTDTSAPAPFVAALEAQGLRVVQA